ncbi:MAG: hypothetical protein J0M02_00825 [Planctomycetes bacterium]|nr:hypothetical protein [Planctomycetota bacterium]
MSIHFTSIHPALIALLAITPAIAAAEPVFQATGGAITIGKLKVELGSNGVIQILRPGTTTPQSDFHFPTVRTGDSKWQHAAMWEGRAITVDPVQHTTVMRGNLPLADGSTLPMSWGYRLLPDGTIRITARNEGSKPLKDQARAWIAFHSARSLHTERPITVDTQAFSIPPLNDGETASHPMYTGPAKPVSFTISLPAKLSLNFDHITELQISDKRDATKPTGGQIQVNAPFTADEASVDLRLADDDRDTPPAKR